NLQIFCFLFCPGTILLSLTLSQAFSDCDDPDVFKAVDAALKKYNGDIATGNQFALHMVMEAKRTVSPDAQFYVKYRIRETTCATEEKKLWQDCDYKVSAEAEKLKPGAVLHEVLFLFVLFCFAATPKITLTQATCLGCFHPISSDSSVVLEILKQAIQKFNKHSGEPALFKLVEIKEATRQVVAGWNYAIKYEIEETNCSKDQFQDLTPECKTTSRGVKTVIPATQTGCPKTVANDNPELKELLKVSMEKYNSESNDDFYYKSGEIQAATVQEVAGQKYHITFEVRKTNCSKTDFEKINEDCEATSDSVSNDDVANCNIPHGQIHFAETASEIVNPGVSRKETSTPAEPLILPDTSLFNVLSDRPESPLPRCPGKPWKEIMDIPAPSSFPREFTNEDLLPSAAENSNPATENSTPSQNEMKDLDLSDALL
uniref:Uncharacterized protein n=1 Tax=Melopsittacus undulatus TaxID=13146 RepID=A0A8C6JBM1_MELUD